MDEKSAKNGSEYQRPSNEEKLKELTDKLQDGVKAVRDSAEYKKLLATMAKFPHYSLNNCMLIAMQKPDATLCQGYNAWKKMGRYVRKGEKGIKVIAPSPYTIQKEVDVLDSKGRPVLDQDGEPVKQTKELNLMGFKAETTFDISQTEGKELPRVGVDELKGSIDKYEVLMGVLKDISPVPIGFEDIKSGAKGYYHTEDKRIAVQQGMSELQTLKTCIHEITHAMLHGDTTENISKNRKELEAEGTASIVLSFMGYNTDDYSYPYLCGYTSDADMKELKASLGTIRQTSSRIIKKIEDTLGEIYKERNPEIVPDNEPEKDSSGKMMGVDEKEISTSNKSPISNVATRPKEKEIAERTAILVTELMKEPGVDIKPIEEVTKCYGIAQTNAWYGGPKEFHFLSEKGQIDFIGHTYECGYEDFSATTTIMENGKVLFDLDGVCTGAYKISVRNEGSFKSGSECIKYLEEKYKNESFIAVDRDGQIIPKKKTIGTVRILPDGAGGKKQSLLDSLKVEKEKIKNRITGNTGKDEKGVAI